MGKLERLPRLAESEEAAALVVESRAEAPNASDMIGVISERIFCALEVPPRSQLGSLIVDATRICQWLYDSSATDVSPPRWKR